MSPNETTSPAAALEAQTPQTSLGSALKSPEHRLPELTGIALTPQPEPELKQEAPPGKPAAAEPKPRPRGLRQIPGHCRLIASELNPETATNRPEIVEFVISNVAKAEGGDKLLRQRLVGRPGIDAEALDASIVRWQGEDVIPLTCEHARVCAPGVCPTSQNCIRPDGVPVKSPLDVVTWDQYCRPGTKDLEVAHPYWAQAFVDRFFPLGFVYHMGKFWGYRKGAFAPLDRLVDIQRPLTQMMFERATDRHVSNIVKFLMNYTAVDASYFAPYATTHVCLDNGTLRLDDGRVIAHSPEHRLRNRLYLSHVPGAECPKFLAFLDQVFQPDRDRAEKIRVLRQWMGYLLTSDTSQQMMFWLVGEGSNGKSVLLQVIRALIGEHNISAVSPGDLSNKFSRASTDGKTLNICSDLPPKAAADGFWKVMVAGEAVEARGFDQDSKTFKTTVRFMAAMNTLPKTTDLTDGYFRRIAILTFNRRFRGDEVNPNLPNELMEELPGILNWAIEGLMDLRRETRFSLPPSSNAAIEEYRVEADPVLGFAAECLRPATNGSRFQSRPLRAVFTEWARQRGLRAEAFNDTSFGRAMGRTGHEKVHSGRQYWLVEPTDAGAAYFAAVGVVAEGQGTRH